MKVKIVKQSKERKISKDIEKAIIKAIERILTPKWKKGETLLKRKKNKDGEGYDVAQSWMNAIIKSRLESEGFEVEAGPLKKKRPETMLERSGNQAIDFEKNCGRKKRHVIEVECGNVASLYRSIHKICMAMRENPDTIGVIIVPDKKLIGRCDSAATMSSSENAILILSEMAYYNQMVKEINVIEFSSDKEINIAALKDNSKFWKGNWSKEKGVYLKKNISNFLKSK
ncbi:MAG: hypothetical protein VW551_06970 [Euryarchaeota archaeon]